MRTISSEVAGVSPASPTCSSKLSRIPSAKSAPVRRRISVAASIAKRQRWATSPPYPSVRRFVNGDRNCVIR